MHSSELTKCLSDFFKIIMHDVVRKVEFLIDIQELSSPILFFEEMCFYKVHGLFFAYAAVYMTVF